MFNKKALRAINISPPSNLATLFDNLNDNDAVISFNVVNADHKRLLIIDTYFKNGRHIRSFNHFTSKKKEYINLVNNNYWSTTTLLWYKTNNITEQNRSFALQELYHYYFYSDKVIINKGTAIKYLKLNSNIDDGSLLRTITTLQSENRPYKTTSSEMIVNKIPCDKVSASQRKWMKEHFHKDMAEKPYRKTFHYYFIQKVNKALVIRHFIGIVKDDYICESFREVIEEGKPIRYFEYVSAYGTAYAWHKGCIPRNWGYKLPGILYPKNLDRTVKSFDELKYCPLYEMARNEIPSKWDKFILGYYKHPELELLIKNEMYSLAESISTGWCSGLHNDTTTAHEFLGIPKYYIRFLKSKYSNTASLSFLRKVLEKKIKVRDDDLSVMCDVASYGQNKTFSLFQTSALLPPSFHKILKYLMKQSSGLKSLDKNISLYIDYIETSEMLGCDLSSKRVYYPKSIQKAHDDTMKAYEAKKSEILKESYDKFYKELSYLNNKVIDKYIFKFPDSSEAFVKQGNYLSQCIRSGSYYEKMANYYCVMVFLYDKKTNEPLYTLDIRDGQIYEFRGMNNKQAPKDAIYAAKHFIRLLNQRLVFGRKITLREVKAEPVASESLTA